MFLQSLTHYLYMSSFFISPSLRSRLNDHLLSELEKCRTYLVSWREHLLLQCMAQGMYYILDFSLFSGLWNISAWKMLNMRCLRVIYKVHMFIWSPDIYSLKAVLPIFILLYKKPFQDLEFLTCDIVPIFNFFLILKYANFHIFLD